MAFRVGDELNCEIFPDFAAVLKMPAVVIAVDIPIGLPNKGRRAADELARKILGHPRCCSVFFAPIRPLLTAQNWKEALFRSRQIEGRGISQQAWGIVKKIKQVDDALRSEPTARSRVFEVHPELCFWQMAGDQPMRHHKADKLGCLERLRVLQFCGLTEQDILVHSRRLRCQRDDILDAVAALWTGERIAREEARSFPPDRVEDSEGLPMQIWA